MQNSAHLFWGIVFMKTTTTKKSNQHNSNILEEFLARQKQLGGMYWLSMCKQCKNTEYEYQPIQNFGYENWCNPINWRKISQSNAKYHLLKYAHPCS